MATRCPVAMRAEDFVAGLSSTRTRPSSMSFARKCGYIAEKAAPAHDRVVSVVLVVKVRINCSSMGAVLRFAVLIDLVPQRFADVIRIWSVKTCARKRKTVADSLFVKMTL